MHCWRSCWGRWWRTGRRCCGGGPLAGFEPAKAVAVVRSLAGLLPRVVAVPRAAQAGGTAQLAEELGQLRQRKRRRPRRGIASSTLPCPVP
ncbi:MAG: hypothetical protein U0797_26370 [Gemmataceae bacterium]